MPPDPLEKKAGTLRQCTGMKNGEASKPNSCNAQEHDINSSAISKISKGDK